MGEVTGFMFRGKNGAGNTTKTKVWFMGDVLFIQGYFVTKEKLKRKPKDYKLLTTKLGLSLYRKEIYLRQETVESIYYGMLIHGKD